MIDNVTSTINNVENLINSLTDVGSMIYECGSPYKLVVVFGCIPIQVPPATTMVMEAAWQTFMLMQQYVVMV